MSILRKFLSINLTSLLIYSSWGHAATISTLQNQPISSDLPASTLYTAMNNNKSFFYISLLYIKPNSDNLKYATFVSGTQPYYQSWHYQAIDPSYHAAFDLGFNYAIPCTSYSTAIYWTHLNSNDADFKQANTNTDLTTVEFVGPPFEMSPPVFGIKRGDSTVNFAFDNMLLNVSKLFEYDPQIQAPFFSGSHVQARISGGLSLLKLNQTMNTTFSDYAGSPATPYSYPLPPDPSFSFELENVSRYLGLGPDLGLSVAYKTASGFGIMGELLGTLTVGTIKTQDNFTSTSSRLTQLGIGISHQQITAPNATQVVMGTDGKLGVFYDYQGTFLPNLTIELGYRMAMFLNAISTVNPNTLVQPGTVIITPEFSTGTMAIVSTDARSRPFSFNGPFLDVKIDIA